MPGVLIIEALAQTGALAVLAAPENRGKLALFAGIERAKFRRPVRPGDTIELEMTLTRSRGPLGEGEANATTKNSNSNDAAKESIQNYGQRLICEGVLTIQVSSNWTGA